MVQAERSLYNSMVSDAKTTCRDSGLATLEPSAPCSRKMTMHYSFDYAQQVHLPSNPQQPGPIYFWCQENVPCLGFAVRECLGK